jgi:hypothetical protein
MLYPELLAPFDMHAIMRDGQPLDHAEAASKPLRSRPPSLPRQPMLIPPDNWPNEAIVDPRVRQNVKDLCAA